MSDIYAANIDLNLKARADLSGVQTSFDSLFTTLQARLSALQSAGAPEGTSVAAGAGIVGAAVAGPVSEYEAANGPLSAEQVAQIQALGGTYTTVLQEQIAAASRMVVHQEQMDAALQSAASEYVTEAIEANKLAAKQAELAAASDKYLTSMVDSATKQNELAAKKADELAASEEYLASYVEVSTKNQLLAAAKAEELAGNAVYIESTAGLAEAQAVLAAKKAEELVGDDILIQATAKETVDKQRRAAQVAEELKANDTYITAIATGTVAQEELNAAILTRANILRAEAGLPLAEIGGGRQGPPLPPLPPVPPESGSGSGLTDNFGSRAVRLGQYAIIGPAIAGTAIAIKDVIGSGNELQAIFAQLQAQLSQTGQGQFLGQIKAQVDDIAKSTGVAAPAIAAAMSGLIGAFGSVPTALQYAQQAAQIAKVTGSDLKTVVADLTPTSLAFQTSFTSISDYAIKARDAFGVNAGSLLDFFSKASPLAKQFGVSLDELSAIGGSALTHLGTSASGVAEDLNRVFPNLQKQSATVIEALQGGGQGAAAQQFGQQVGAGNLGGALEALISVYGRLNPAQQQFIEETLGSTRGTKDFAAILETSGGFLNYVKDQTNGAGLTAAAFAQQQSTLKGQLSDLGQQALVAGRDLYNDGLGKALEELVAVIEEALKVVEAFGHILGDLDSALGGIPAKLAAIAAGLRLLQAVGNLSIVQRIGGAVGIGGGSEKDNVAEQRDALAQQRYTLAQQRYELAQQQYQQALRQYELDQQRYAVEQEQVGVAGGGIPLGGVSTIGGAAEGPAIGNAAALTLEGGFFGVVTGGIESFIGVLKSLSFLAIPAAVIAVTTLINKAKEIEATLNAETSNITDRATQAYLSGQSPQQILASAGLTPDSGRGGVSGIIARNVGAANLVDPEAVAVAAIQQGIENGRRQQAAAPFQGVLQQLDSIVSVASQEHLPGGLTDNIKQYIDDLTKGNVDQITFAGEKSKELLAYLAQQDPKLFDAIRKIQASAAAATSVSALADSASQLKSAYSSGQATLGEYLNVLDQQIAALQTAGGQAGDPAGKALQQALNDRNTVVSNSIKNEADLLVKMQDLNGGDQTQADLQILESALNNPKLTAGADRKALVDQILTLLQKESNTLKTSLAIPAEAQAQIEAEIIQNDSAWSETLANFRVNEQGVLAIAESATKAHISFNQAFYDFESNALKLEDDVIKLVLKDPFLSDALRQQLNQTLADNYLKAQELEGLAGQLPKIEAPGTVSPGATSTTNPDQTLAQRLALHKAEAEFNAAAAGNSPTAQAQSEMEQAQADLKDAQDRLSQNPNDLVAQADYWKARTEELKGQQDMAKAAVGIMDAQFQYYEALAKFSGNDLQAAQLQLQEAQANLAKAPSEGINPGSSAYIDLQTNVTNAQANLRDTQLKQEEDQITFRQQMGQITDVQAAQLYEQLLQLPTLTQQERQDIELKVHDLLKSSDLSTNIPTDINLPTLYEVNRLNQTAAGSSYSGQALDQRQQNFNFYINGPDIDQIQKVVAGAAGNSGLYSTGTRRY